MSTSSVAATTTSETDPEKVTTTAPTTVSAPPSEKKKRVVRRVRRPRNPIPDALLNDPVLANALTSLPSSYNFEVHKTIHAVRSNNLTRIALQMPEGLLMYGPIISDIVRRWGGGSVEEVFVMGDVTYGACCVDDFTARDLGCDLLVHYGHSCLVPINKSLVRTIYVFVEIRVDVEHVVECLKSTIAPPARVNVMGTVQFRSAIAECNEKLRDEGYVTCIPQAKPLSPGEVLGCTSPNKLFVEGEIGEMNGKDQLILFIADGRFHLEAAMIANPRLRAYKYDPYGKILTEEKYVVREAWMVFEERSVEPRTPPRVRFYI